MKRLLSFLSALLLFACQSAPTPKKYDMIRDALNGWFKVPYVDSQPYDVYFATNRGMTGSAIGCNNAVFNVALGTSTNYGLCRVQVPINRPVGSLSSSSDPNSDSQINFQVAQNEGLDASSFQLSLTAHPSDEILIFVHGFNVRFEEAVFRAAQLGFDGKYQGQLVLFSWPAGAQERLIQGPFLLKTYNENRANASASIAAFEKVLQAAIGTRKRINLVVHSMGHQVVLPALARLSDVLPEASIQELILNAPDFATDDFRNMMPKIKKMVRRTTVYCSPNDNALAASTKVNRNARLGNCALIDGVDMIDVSSVDTPLLGVGGLGHGYYSGRPIIADAAQLMMGMEAQRRMFIQRMVPATHANFLLRP